jgi:hypothetical protein
MCVRLFSIGGAFLWQDEHDDTTSPSHDRTGETRQPLLDPNVCSTSQRRPKRSYGPSGSLPQRSITAFWRSAPRVPEGRGGERPMPFLFPSEVSLGPAPNRSAASNHDPIGIRCQRAPRLPEKMTSGVRNPLGAMALYLRTTLYGIHRTNAAKSIRTGLLPQAELRALASGQVRRCWDARGRPTPWRVRGAKILARRDPSPGGMGTLGHCVLTKRS